MSEAGRRGVLDAVVATMDRLRAPGGCPWDAEQTHRSLAPYAIEEAYELAEAAEGDDRAALQEELGDLLLQVVFHARVAEEHPTDPFTLDDVAQVLLDKLVRRHPHVFGAVDGVTSVAQVETLWHETKKREREGDVLAGVPLALPALARAQKVARRLGREGVGDDELAEVGPAAAGAEGAVGGVGTDGEGAVGRVGTDGEGAVAGAADDVGVATDGADIAGRVADAVGSGQGAEAQVAAELMRLVLHAERLGVDAEAALRHHVRGLRSPGADGPT